MRSGELESINIMIHYFLQIKEVEVLLKKYFSDVYVFENQNKSGTVYFWATNGKSPLICKQNV